MIAKSLQDVFINVMQAFTEIPVFAEELRQSFEGQKKFEEGLWVMVMPKFSKNQMLDLDSRIYEMESVYNVQIIYEIAPDYLRKNGRIRDLELLSLPIHIVPKEFSKYFVFDSIVIVGSTISFLKQKSSNNSIKYVMDFDCKINMVVTDKNQTEDKFERFTNLMFETITKLQNKDGGK